MNETEIKEPGYIEVLTYEQFTALGTKLYGENIVKWKFKCVKCGNVQSGQDFIDAGIDSPAGKVFFSCIGRWKKGVGCDWTLGGLFRIHRRVVIGLDGRKVPVFLFADEPEIKTIGEKP